MYSYTKNGVTIVEMTKEEADELQGDLFTTAAVLDNSDHRTDWPIAQRLADLGRALNL